MPCLGCLLVFLLIAGCFCWPIWIVALIVAVFLTRTLK